MRRLLWPLLGKDLWQLGGQYLARAGLRFNEGPVVKVDRRGRAWIADCSERILERPFVLLNLGIQEGHVLDVGCRSALTGLQLASYGFDVTGVDIAPWAVEHPRFRFVQADARSLPFPDGTFDAAVAVSTLEHVGWEDGRRVDAEGDARAGASIRRALKPGGGFLVTVPFGRAALGRGQRVFDRLGIEDLLRGFQIEMVRYGVKDGAVWRVANESEAAVRDSTVHCSAVVMVRCRKPVVEAR